MKEYTIIKILLTIVMILYGIRVASEAARATDGIELYQLQQQTLHYRVVNGELREQIVITKSLSYIDFIARNEMGFVDAQFVYLP